MLQELRHFSKGLVDKVLRDPLPRHAASFHSPAGLLPTVC